MINTTKKLGRPEGLLKRISKNYRIDSDLPKKIETAKNELRNQREDKTTESDIVNDAIRHYLELKGLRV